MATKRYSIRKRRFARAISAVSAVGLLLSGLGLASFSVAPRAEAAERGTSVTLNWAGGNGELEQYQPTDRAKHLPGGELADSGKHEDFKDVKVTVSQTQELTDQVVTVKLSGLQTTRHGRSNESSPLGNASNFYQLMQCWGPDPNAADFAETCAFGGLTNQAGFQSGGSILNSTGLEPGASKRGYHNSGYFRVEDGVQVDESEYNPRGDDSTRKVLRREGVAFRTAQGAENIPEYNPALSHLINGVGRYFGGTSNEQIFLSSVVGSSTESQFNVISSASNPYLGCGAANEQGEPRRCWLVIVPRGEHGGSVKNAETACRDRTRVNNRGGVEGQRPGYGEWSWYQFGSPMEPNCSFWDDRMVLPLDFQQRTLACGQGAARPVVGTELSAKAVASWQSALCAGDASELFALTTAASTVVGEQLAGGQAPLGLVGAALPGDTALAEPHYAPLMNAGVVLAFRAEFFRDGRYIEQLRLTPRLVAKLLTDSYGANIARVNGVDRSYAAHLANNPYNIGVDPEFVALNGTEAQLKVGRDLMVLGPQGDDGLRTLWEWIRADDKARAFLTGEADEAGMRVNPYFLPAGHPQALGGGLAINLAKDAIDTVPKADQTQAPERVTADLEHRGQQVDTQMMNPFSGSYEGLARRIFTGDLQRKNSWSSLTANSSGEFGVWIGSPQNVYDYPGISTLGVTDAASAHEMGLQVAELQLPNSESFVAPTSESIARAVAAQAAGSASETAVSNVAALPEGAYPLAQTIYAAIDVASPALDEAERAAYGTFIDYAAGAGQTPGFLRGQLPEGYAPLSEAQRARAAEVAAELRNWKPAQSPAPGSAPGANTQISPVNTPTAAAVGSTPSSGSPQTQVSPGSGATAGDDTAAPAGTATLLGLLAASIGGLAFGPLMLRRGGAA